MFNLSLYKKKKKNSKVQAWLEIMISLKIEFELELVGKQKNLSWAELCLAWIINQAKLNLNIKFKLELRSSFWDWDMKKLHY